MTSQNNTANTHPGLIDDQANKGVSLALWGNTNSGGAHVSGKINKQTEAGEMRSINLTGFFNINQKGDVSIRLSTKKEGAYVPVGIIYIGKNGMQFYPNSNGAGRGIPRMRIKETGALQKEFVELLDKINRIGNESGYNTSRSNVDQQASQSNINGGMLNDSKSSIRNYGHKPT